MGVNQLLELLVAYGPALLFTLAVLETSFVTGLFVPSGVATSLATVLALQGRVELVPMIVAATVGGAVGDSIGFGSDGVPVKGLFSATGGGLAESLPGALRWKDSTGNILCIR